jgi:hypothetical protein
MLCRLARPGSLPDTVAEELNCMLRLNKGGGSQRPDKLEEWMKTLEFIAATIKAGRVVADVEYIRTGTI